MPRHTTECHAALAWTSAHSHLGQTLLELVVDDDATGQLVHVTVDPGKVSIDLGRPPSERRASAGSCADLAACVRPPPVDGSAPAVTRMTSIRVPSLYMIPPRVYTCGSGRHRPTLGRYPGLRSLA